MNIKLCQTFYTKRTFPCLSVIIVVLPYKSNKGNSIKVTEVTLMNSSINTFESITELAEHLNISRKTLYQRAKKHNIALTGKYSTEEIEKLSSRVSPTVTPNKGNSKQQKVTDDSNTIIELKEQIKAINLDKDFLRQEIQVKNSQINQLNKQVDQAQQLQLIAEQRLNDEHQKVIELSERQNNDQPKKGFWARLFSGE